jgi:hypothetical protein
MTCVLGRRGEGEGVRGREKLEASKRCLKKQSALSLSLSLSHTHTCLAMAGSRPGGMATGIWGDERGDEG